LHTTHHLLISCSSGRRSCSHLLVLHPHWLLHHSHRRSPSWKHRLLHWWRHSHHLWHVLWLLLHHHALLQDHRLNGRRHHWSRLLHHSHGLLHLHWLLHHRRLHRWLLETWNKHRLRLLHHWFWHLHHGLERPWLHHHWRLHHIHTATHHRIHMHHGLWHHHSGLHSLEHVRIVLHSNTHHLRLSLGHHHLVLHHSLLLHHLVTHHCLTLLSHNRIEVLRLNGLSCQILLHISVHGSLRSHLCVSLHLLLQGLNLILITILFGVFDLPIEQSFITLFGSKWVFLIIISWELKAIVLIPVFRFLKL
jgi:hypothetical protein